MRIGAGDDLSALLPERTRADQKWPTYQLGSEPSKKLLAESVVDFLCV
jgi:hypothetical protein